MDLTEDAELNCAWLRLRTYEEVKKSKKKATDQYIKAADLLGE